MGEEEEERDPPSHGGGVAYIEFAIPTPSFTQWRINEKLMLAVLVLLITRNNAWSSGMS